MWENLKSCNKGFIYEEDTIKHSITFHPVVELDSGATYSWDFGDETTTEDVSTEANPSYTYPALGMYNVVLTATGTCADQNTTSQSLDLSVGITDFNNINSVFILNSDIWRKRMYNILWR